MRILRGFAECCVGRTRQSGPAALSLARQQTAAERRGALEERAEAELELLEE